MKLRRTSTSSKLRTTPIRTALLAVLGVLSTPTTAPELLRALVKKKVACDRVTIYRQLATLVKSGHVREELLHRAKSYELVREGEHRHHFVCARCHRATPFPTTAIESALAAVERALRRKHFSVTRHTLALFGECPKCKSFTHSA